MSELPSVAFNSLFEMRARHPEVGVAVQDESFNSLFEMPAMLRTGLQLGAQ